MKQHPWAMALFELGSRGLFGIIVCRPEELPHSLQAVVVVTLVTKARRFACGFTSRTDWQLRVKVWAPRDCVTTVDGTKEPLTSFYKKMDDGLVVDWLVRSSSTVVCPVSGRIYSSWRLRISRHFATVCMMICTGERLAQV